MADFAIVHRTGAKPHGGTDYDVQARIVYTSGSVSDWKTLDNSGNDREQGDVDCYRVSFPSGKPKSLQMRVKHEAANVNRDPNYDDWYLTWLAVAEIDTSIPLAPRIKDGLYYHPNQYFTVRKGDASWNILDLGAPADIPIEKIAEIIASII
jgi:hypothetical protein